MPRIDAIRVTGITTATGHRPRTGRPRHPDRGLSTWTAVQVQRLLQEPDGVGAPPLKSRIFKSVDVKKAGVGWEGTDPAYTQHTASVWGNQGNQVIRARSQEDCSR